MLTYNFIKKVFTYIKARYKADCKQWDRLVYNLIITCSEGRIIYPQNNKIVKYKESTIFNHARNFEIDISTALNHWAISRQNRKDNCPLPVYDMPLLGALTISRWLLVSGLVSKEDDGYSFNLQQNCTEALVRRS